MQWGLAVVGLLLLAFGRRLYWLFVGGIGFVVGFSVASAVSGHPGDLTALLIGLGAGLVGVVLALLLQKFAIVLAGLLGGGWLGAELWRLFATGPPPIPWLPALGGALLGALLAATLFDAVLIALSSLVGAALLAGLLARAPEPQALVFLVLALVGIVIQTRSRHGGSRRSRE